MPMPAPRTEFRLLLWPISQGASSSSSLWESGRQGQGLSPAFEFPASHISTAADDSWHTCFQLLLARSKHAPKKKKASSGPASGTRRTPLSFNNPARFDEEDVVALLRCPSRRLHLYVARTFLSSSFSPAVLSQPLLLSRSAVLHWHNSPGAILCTHNRLGLILSSRWHWPQP